MAKGKATKKKGPKGKKARAKVKLDRQWGESAIVDDEKPRRVGKSRLLARTKYANDDGDENKTVRFASNDKSRRPRQDPTSATEAKATKSIIKSTSTYTTTKSRYNNSKHTNFGEDDIVDSEGEDLPPLEGLLRTIQRAKEKNRGRKVHRRNQHDEDPLYDEMNEDQASDVEMDKHNEDIEDDDDDDEDDLSIQDEDLDDDDELDENDSVTGKTNADTSIATDLFHHHFGKKPLSPDEIEKRNGSASTSAFTITVNESIELNINGLFVETDSSSIPPVNAKTRPGDLGALAESSFEVNRKILQHRWKRMQKSLMTENQSPIYPFLTRYMDLLVTAVSRKERKELQRLYLLHILNHVLTSRSRVQRHNRQLKELEEKEQAENTQATEKGGDPASVDIEPDRFRDQGFTRPTVLVLLPTRGTCHAFVHNLLKMIGAEPAGPHMERFDVEYGKPEDADDDGDENPLDSESDRRRKAVLEAKGKDWNELFGDDTNHDDDFKLGIALTPKAAGGKKSSNSSNVQVKLYTDFYKSDIIIASPLGLKVLIAPDEEGKGGDSDFLSSIEICLVQQADVQMMQNWDHANDILGLLNKEPEKNNDTDFSRVRNYLLEGQGAHWRQLIISTEIVDPFLLSSFKRFGKSIAGSVKMRKKYLPEDAALAKVLVPMKQVFQRVAVPSFDQQTDGRVNYFVKHILPEIQRHKQKHTMVYIPSYFDFVALRNIFLKREISFVSVHEYSRVSEVSRSRARFLQGRKPIMLFTGRCNFFHRHAIKGIRHLIFLGLPEHPQFYADQVNLINTSTKQQSDDVDMAASMPSSCIALFTKFEGYALERVVGSANCGRMLKSEKGTFMFHS